MPLNIRRVVTGHDDKGRALVQIDEVMSQNRETRPGASNIVAWTTHGFPIDNDDDADGAKRDVATTHDTGTVFRVVQYLPGVAERNHRTDSVDYAVVISGEIDMQLDDGREVHLKAGDLLVQRGTMHNWVNRGSVPCLIAFVLISAKPVSKGGATLRAVG